jgi:hypothetical protein
MKSYPYFLLAISLVTVCALPATTVFAATTSNDIALLQVDRTNTAYLSLATGDSKLGTDNDCDW